MATYFFNPNDYPVGTLPTGWAEYGTSGKATIANDATLGNYLKTNKLNTASFDTMVAWETVGNLSSADFPVEFVTKLRWAIADISEPGITWADPATWNGYRAFFVDRNDIMRLRRYDAGSSVNLAAPGIGAIAEGEVWWMRWRIDANGRHLVRVWKDGTTEPTTWNIDVIDSTYQSGKIGFEIQRFGENHYFLLGVGTVGDPAPTSAAPSATTVDVALIGGQAAVVAQSNPIAGANAVIAGNAGSIATQGTPIINPSALLSGPPGLLSASGSPVLDATSAFTAQASALASNGSPVADADIILQIADSILTASASLIAELNAALQGGSANAAAIEALIGELRKLQRMAARIYDALSIHANVRSALKLKAQIENLLTITAKLE